MNRDTRKNYIDKLMVTGILWRLAIYSLYSLKCYVWGGTIKKNSRAWYWWWLVHKNVVQCIEMQIRLLFLCCVIVFNGVSMNENRDYTAIVLTIISHSLLVKIYILFTNFLIFPFSLRFPFRPSFPLSLILSLTLKISTHKSFTFTSIPWSTKL